MDRTTAKTVSKQRNRRQSSPPSRCVVDVSTIDMSFVALVQRLLSLLLRPRRRELVALEGA